MEKWKAQCVFITHNIFIRLFFITAAVVWTLGLQTSNVFVVPLAIILWFFLKSDRIQTIRQDRKNRKDSSESHSRCICCFLGNGKL